MWTVIKGLSRFLPGGGIISTILSMPSWVWIGAAALAGVMYIRYDARKDEAAVWQAKIEAARAELVQERAAAGRQVDEDSRVALEIYRAENEVLKDELEKHRQNAGDARCPIGREFLDSLPSQKRTRR